MRDKKFRAWDKVTGTYLYSNKFPSMWQFYKELENRGIRHWETEDCTGLKDKNGIEIYEGDIVKEEGSYQSGTYHWENIYKVESDAPNGGFNLRDNEGEYKDLFYQDLEVIGNIYKNPELLDVG